MKTYRIHVNPQAKHYTVDSETLDDAIEKAKNMLAKVYFDRVFICSDHDDEPVVNAILMPDLGELR